MQAFSGGPGQTVAELPYGRVVSAEQRFPVKPVLPLTVMLVERPGSLINDRWFIADDDRLSVRIVDFAPPSGGGVYLLPGRYRFEGAPFDAVPKVGFMPKDFDGMEFLEVVPTNSGVFLNAAFKDGAWFAAPLPGPNTNIFPVEMILTGGTQGTTTAKPSWRYTVRDINTREVLGEDVFVASGSNHARRPNLGQIRPASFGTAFFDNGELIITSTNEQPIQVVCG